MLKINNGKKKLNEKGINIYILVICKKYKIHIGFLTKYTLLMMIGFVP